MPSTARPSGYILARLSSENIFVPAAPASQLITSTFSRNS
eukprot:CAMPEP_0170459390 /NCGR_PEP_ID=MMETSP0123-20130129/6103_1 /TAXON_ID=182087 /ORGANISM="Favella ehrenbergii, Strain Fehren 1" /LENGTH=39 /DNA_ID= /DNA_START= /DNA_END= /DNA_ORIENTATION=